MTLRSLVIDGTCPVMITCQCPSILIVVWGSRRVGASVYQDRGGMNEVPFIVCTCNDEGHDKARKTNHVKQAEGPWTTHHLVVKNLLIHQ